MYSKATACIKIKNKKLWLFCFPNETKKDKGQVTWHHGRAEAKDARRIQPRQIRLGVKVKQSTQSLAWVSFD